MEFHSTTRHERDSHRGFKHAALRQRVVMLAIAATLWTPVRADAAACCMSATAYGVGRLKIWENAAAGSTLTMLHTLGSWGPDSAYTGLEDASANDLRATVWGLVRVHRRGAIWVRLPAQLGFRRAQGVQRELSTRSGAMGDIDAGLRWAWVEVGEILGYPAIATTVGVTTPTGRGQFESDDALGADVSGRGVYAVTLSTSLERTKLPWFVRGVLALALPLPFTRKDTGVVQRFGPSIALNLSGGHELRAGLVISALVSATWESSLISDGKAIDNSASLVSTGTIALAWQFMDDWTLQAAGGGGLPITGLGRNRDVQLTTTLGLRYGFTL